MGQIGGCPWAIPHLFYLLPCGAGSENESVKHISKEILCAQQSFGPCGPSLQDVVEAKTLAIIKEGFPGPWDKQEHPVLKKDSFCAFGV